MIIGIFINGLQRILIFPGTRIIIICVWGDVFRGEAALSLISRPDTATEKTYVRDLSATPRHPPSFRSNMDLARILKYFS